MTLGGMVFGYVMCNVQSNSSTAVEGFRRLRMVTTGFSMAIVLVSPAMLMNVDLNIQ